MALTLKMYVPNLVLTSTNILVESLSIMVEQVNLSVISVFHRIFLKTFSALLGVAFN